MYYIVGEIAECLTHVPGVCLQVQKRPMFYVQSIKSWSGSSRKRPMHVRSLTLCLWKDDAYLLSRVGAETVERVPQVQKEVCLCGR